MIFYSENQGKPVCAHMTDLNTQVAHRPLCYQTDTPDLQT